MFHDVIYSRSKTEIYDLGWLSLHWKSLSYSLAEQRSESPSDHEAAHPLSPSLSAAHKTANFHCVTLSLLSRSGSLTSELGSEPQYWDRADRN